MNVILDNLDLYWLGVKTTVGLTLLAFTFAVLIGVVIAAFRVGPVPPLRWAGATWVEVFRNTPLAVLFVLFFFGLPKLGFIWSPYTSAVIVLSAYTSAFVAETIRAGINTVGRGQAEAGRALGLTFLQVLNQVVLPQALRTVVAPMGNLFIALTKNTSVAYTISVLEITGRADRLNTATARPIPVFLGAALAYLLLTLPSGFVIGAIERRVSFTR